ncbi:MAG: OmpA family protein [Vicingus serpentipes]|nr:OmpA family protein [Vicingus serpentipes]
MIIDKRIGFFIVFLFSFLGIAAQEEYPDCTNPKKIELPLTKAVDSLSQSEIYYQPADKYTYWYRMEVTEAAELSYQLTAISEGDEYELLVYKYDGTNFCNDLVDKTAKVISNSTDGKINASKGEVYYFGVLHLTGYGCGHQLFLDTKNKTTTLKAIQNECIEEALETMMEEEVVEEKEKNTVIKGVVVNSNTGENIEAKLFISSVNGGIQQPINSSVTNGFELTDFKEERIVVAIEKFGYETLNDTIEITSNSLKIAMNPIKIGQKLVMHKIYFHPNTYVLKQESKQELEKLSQFMKENNNYFFEIQGHTNGNRSIKKMQQYAHLGEEWNFKGTAKKLSKFRAEKIKDYLVKNGVDETKLATVGYGGDQMIIAQPKNMKQAMKNIRVEVIVVQ